MRSIADSAAADAARHPPLHVVMGPTAAGKSSLALQLAEANGLAIISADSRQVYRHFDIGTAKPSAAEQARVPHFGIDVIDPVERYSAHRWATDAELWRAAAQRDGRQALVVGGTGFYVRALVRPLHAVPALAQHRRAALERWLANLDRETLARWCRRLDPPRASLGRTQLLRAVETVLLTGSRLSDTFSEQPPHRAVRYLVVDPGEPLAARIRHRVQAMVDAGWADEVRSLMSTVPADAPAWLASGYAAMRDHVVGRATLDATMERVVIETRQYAKRQRTWCRHQLTEGTVDRIDPGAPDAVERVHRWWQQGQEAAA